MAWPLLQTWNKQSKKKKTQRDRKEETLICLWQGHWSDQTPLKHPAKPSPQPTLILVLGKEQRKPLPFSYLSPIPFMGGQIKTSTKGLTSNISRDLRWWQKYLFHYYYKLKYISRTDGFADTKLREWHKYKQTPTYPDYPLILAKEPEAVSLPSLSQIHSFTGGQSIFHAALLA